MRPKLRFFRKKCKKNRPMTFISLKILEFLIRKPSLDVLTLKRYNHFLFKFTYKKFERIFVN